MISFFINNNQTTNNNNEQQQRTTLAQLIFTNSLTYTMSYSLVCFERRQANQKKHQGKMNLQYGTRSSKKNRREAFHKRMDCSVTHITNAGGRVYKSPAQWQGIMETLPHISNGYPTFFQTIKRLYGDVEFQRRFVVKPGGWISATGRQVVEV